MRRGDHRGFVGLGIQQIVVVEDAQRSGRGHRQVVPAPIGRHRYGLLTLAGRQFVKCELPLGHGLSTQLAQQQFPGAHQRRHLSQARAHGFVPAQWLRMRRHGDAESGGGDAGIVVIIRSERGEQQARLCRITRLLQRPCAPVAPAGTLPVRLGHRGNGLSHQRPIACPHRGAGAPLEGIVIQLMSADAREILLRMRIAAPGERQGHGEREGAGTLRGQVARANQLRIPVHGGIRVLARQPHPAGKQRFGQHRRAGVVEQRVERGQWRIKQLRPLLQRQRLSGW